MGNRWETRRTEAFSAGVFAIAITLLVLDIGTRLRYANDTVMRINLLLLMAVSFLPFPTRLVAEAIRDQSAERAAAIFYGVCLLAIALLFSALGGRRSRPRAAPTRGDRR